MNTRIGRTGAVSAGWKTWINLGREPEKADIKRTGLRQQAGFECRNLVSGDLHCPAAFNHLLNERRP